MQNYRPKFAVVIGLILIITGFLVLVYPQTNIAAGDDAKGRIAYVDLWTVFNVHPGKASAEEELNMLAQDMQAELEEKASDLPEAQQQEMLQEYQTKLSQQEQELIEGIIDEIKAAIVDVAEEKEVKLVVDKQSIFYGGYDLTQDVIDYINKQQRSLQEPLDATEEELSDELTGD